MHSVKKEHWEQVYKTHNPDQVSWSQAVPLTSLEFIRDFQLSESAKIIDIGGGDSLLADYLLKEGFRDITVLDISAAALEKAKARLGEDCGRIKWVVSDINDFHPVESYDLWHDRATFHFLTNESEVASYLNIAAKATKKYLVMGTFSEKGPEKCSGLPVKQYSGEQLQKQLAKDFIRIRCIHRDHITPFETRQNFLFCSFKKRQASA